MSVMFPQRSCGIFGTGKAEKGDILYTKDGTLGIPCVVDVEMAFSFS
jgi:hypothetical protein